MQEKPSIDEVEDISRQLAELRAQISSRKREGAAIDDLIAEHVKLNQQLQQAKAAQSIPSDKVPAEDNTPLKVSVITTDEEFIQLRDEWGDLLERCQATSVYYSWEWLYAWWKIYNKGKQLRLITLRNADHELCALAPLMLGQRRRGNRSIRKTTLALLGTGEGPLGNGMSFLVDHRQPEAVIALWRVCCDLAPEWDEIHLDDVCPSAPLWLQFIAETLQQERLVITQTTRLGVVGQLPTTFEAYLAQMPSYRRRRNLRTALRKLESISARVEIRRETTADHASEYCQFLTQNSISRLSEKGKESAWLSESFRECMALVIPLLAERHRLRFDVLYIDGEIAAVVMGFVTNSTYQGFQSAFNAKYAELSPNHCLWARCIEACIREGLTGFDFGAGEHDYKTGYFADRIPTGYIVISQREANAILRTGAGMFWQGVRATTRRLIQNRSSS